MSPSVQTPPAFATLIEAVASRARSAGVFADVTVGPSGLSASATGSAAPASYWLTFAGGRVWVALQTADRWLSQSIEQDLVHTGDKLDELLEEEMVELGYSGPRLAFEHFRSPEKLFTFRSPLPLTESQLADQTAADLATLALLGYEACFRRLGDMEGGDDE